MPDIRVYGGTMRIREKGICAGPRAAGGVTRWRLLLGGGHVDAEGGEDDSQDGRMGELRFIDNSAGNGGGDLDQQERADQVTYSSNGDGAPGAERAGRDRGGHRVGGVVEAVGELEA